MPEWLVEEGIGETRAILVDGDRVLATKLRWPGELEFGELVSATLARKPAGQRRGLAIDEKGREIAVDRIPADVTEGSRIAIEVTRAAIAERGRLKHAQGRFAGPGSPPSVAPDPLLVLADTVRRFDAGLWEDIWEEASAGQVAFAGGSLLMSVTPAMTVVDIDGDLPPRQLALAAAGPIARSLRLFDIGGSIGIDFPTLEAKADRKAVDAALEDALADFPHERTAMNGFGFVQIVTRLEGPSLLHRFATSRTGMAARMALRRAERLDGAGTTLLTVHPALKAKLRDEWLTELERRTGRPLRIETDPGLAIEAATAQIVGHE